MPIRVTCACGKAYHLKDEFAGRRAKCPACGQVVQIPGRGLGASVPAPERTCGGLAPSSRHVPGDANPQAATSQPSAEVDRHRGLPKDPEWLRAKPEIVEALHSGDYVDKAWALDLLGQYVQKGVEEAKQLRSELVGTNGESREAPASAPANGASVKTIELNPSAPGAAWPAKIGSALALLLAFVLAQILGGNLVAYVLSTCSLIVLGPLSIIVMAILFGKRTNHD